MLNEIKEYEEYNIEIDSQTKPRLIPSFIKGENCAGIRRALTIIAREHLFSEHYESLDIDKRKALREETYLLLLDWLSLSDNEQTGWFKNYLDYYDAYPKKLKGTKEENWTAFKKNKLTNWASNDSFKKTNRDFASQNAFTLGMIIADAINEGPLKERYLICKKNFLEHISCSTDNASAKKSAPNKNQIEQLLKIISYYFIQSEKNNTNLEWAPINSVDLSNWMGIKAFGSSNHTTTYRYNYLSIINIKDGIIRISKEYLKEYEFNVIDDKDAFLNASNKEDFYLYEDHGAGKESLQTTP